MIRRRSYWLPLIILLELWQRLNVRVIYRLQPNRYYSDADENNPGTQRNGENRAVVVGGAVSASNDAASWLPLKSDDYLYPVAFSEAAETEESEAYNIDEMYNSAQKKTGCRGRAISEKDISKLNDDLENIATDLAKNTYYACENVQIHDVMSDNIYYIDPTEEPLNEDGTANPKFNLTDTQETTGIRVLRTDSQGNQIDDTEHWKITHDGKNITAAHDGPVDPNYTYTLTYPAIVSDTGKSTVILGSDNYDPWADTADDGTGTYSAQKGLYSNEKYKNDAGSISGTYVSWDEITKTTDGDTTEQKSAAYPMPVVRPYRLTISKSLTIEGRTSGETKDGKTDIEKAIPEIDKELRKPGTLTFTVTGDYISGGEHRTFQQDVDYSQFSSDGAYTMNVPDAGTYTVTEKKGPATVSGYTWADDSVKTASVTVSDESVPSDVLTDSNKARIVNDYSKGTQKVTVKKVWNDDNNSEGSRPDSIDVQLYANGKAVGDQKETLSDANNWSYTFDHLPLLDKGKYTVEETNVPEGYNSTIEYSTGKKETTTEKTEKIWVPVKYNDIQGGGSYVIVCNSDKKAFKASSSSNTEGESVELKAGTDDITDSSGNKYSKDSYYPYAGNENLQRWIVEEDDNGVSFKPSADSSIYLHRDEKYVRVFWGGYYVMHYTTSYTNEPQEKAYLGSDGKIKSTKTENYRGSEYTTSYYMSDSSGNVEQDSSDTTFTLYKLVGVPTAEKANVDDPNITNAVITNTKSTDLTSNDVDKDHKIDHRKTIDYLGDGDKNPDTDVMDTDLAKSNTGQDLYRLNLDVTSEASKGANYLFVVDVSNSMQTPSGEVPYMIDVTDQVKSGARKNYDLRKDGRYYIHRLTALKNALKNENIANKIMANGENRIALIPFATRVDEDNVLNWSSSADAFNNKIDNLKTGGATNYDAALQKAETLIKSTGNEYPTYMIFLSDGVPTTYVGKEGNIQEQPPGDGTETVENLGYYGDNGCISYTKGVINTFKNYIKNYKVNIYTIGFTNKDKEMSNAIRVYKKTEWQDGKNPLPYYNLKMDSSGKVSASEAIDNANNDPSFLRYNYLLKELGGDNYREEYDEQGLASLFGGVVASNAVSSVSVSDTLSQYVKVYNPQPDFKVQMTKKDGTKVTLWDRESDKGRPLGQGTGGLPKDSSDSEDAYFTTKAGVKKPIVTSVTYDCIKNSDAADDVTEKVTVHFDPEYVLDGEATYTLSFNVQASTKAYDTYASSGYSSTKGDPGTDYEGNRTSSNKPGFYSNTSTALDYTLDGQAYHDDYDNPVIQVGKTSLNVQKLWQDSKGNEMKPAANSVRIHLYKNGVDTSRYIDLKADAKGEMTGTFDDLAPKELQEDGSYKANVYTVVEDKESAPTCVRLYKYSSGDTASDSYSTLKQDVTGFDSDTDSVIHTYNDGKAGQATVTNKVYTLPSTAGFGTYLYTFLGTLLLALAAAEARRKYREMTHKLGDR